MSTPADSGGPEIDRQEVELMAVAEARDRIEAGMMQGLLEDAGIPSTLQPVGIDGPGVGVGLLNPGGGAQRVLVHAARLEEARALLAETLVEDEESTWPETANARHLGDVSGGRGPRDYGIVGAYTRAWVVAVVVVGVAFGIFLLLRAL
jgi:Putative prokaryotic signal transducing protein